AVQQRAGVVRHERPTGPGPQLRPGRAGARLRAVPGQGHRPGAGGAGAPVPGQDRGPGADHRAVAAGAGPPGQPGAVPGQAARRPGRARGPARPGAAARAGLAGPAPRPEERLDGFWSLGLSPARLRALATVPDAAAPDLLLRMFPPPPVQVRGTDLADVLAPAYQRLAADIDDPSELT